MRPEAPIGARLQWTIALVLGFFICCGRGWAQGQGEAMRHLVKGFEAAQQGRYDEALQGFRVAKALDPVCEYENFPWETRERAARMNEALRIRDQSPDASIQIALELIKQEPANPLPYNHLAWTYYRVKNNPASAEEIFLTSIKVALTRRDRFFVGSFPALGTLYYDTGKKEQARFYYQASLILNPVTKDRKLYETRIAELSR